MKRTRKIDLRAMRKQPDLPKARLLPLAIASILAVSGCSDGPQQQARIFKSIADCKAQMPDTPNVCEQAYTEAQKEAERTSPKYNSVRDCEAEFGQGHCRDYSSGGSSWFIPAVAGFMIGNYAGRRSNQPVYTGTGNMYGGWYGADGVRYGSTSSSRVQVPERAFKSKPSVTRTISRGGFGSSVVAKSWSSSSSRGRSSWGG